MDQIVGRPRKYCADLPYPEIMVTCKNPRYACLILEDYAGMGSELTACTQYVYGSCVMRHQDLEICQALHEISMVEMHHLAMLGELVQQLGADPRFTGCRRDQYWCARSAAYGRSPRSVLLNSINGENHALAQYRKHCQEIRDEGVTNVIRRIILDEEIHLSILKELYAGCGAVMR